MLKCLLSLNVTESFPPCRMLFHDSGRFFCMRWFSLICITILLSEDSVCVMALSFMKRVAPPWQNVFDTHNVRSVISKQNVLSQAPILNLFGAYFSKFTAPEVRLSSQLSVFSKNFVSHSDAIKYVCLVPRESDAVRNVNGPSMADIIMSASIHIFRTSSPNLILGILLANFNRLCPSAFIKTADETLLFEMSIGLYSPTG